MKKHGILYGSLAALLVVGVVSGIVVATDSEQGTAETYQVREARQSSGWVPFDSVNTQLKGQGFREATAQETNAWVDDLAEESHGSLFVFEGFETDGFVAETYDSSISGVRQVTVIGTRGRVGDWRRVLCDPTPDVASSAAITVQDFVDHLRAILADRVQIRPVSAKSVEFLIAPMHCWAIRM